MNTFIILLVAGQIAGVGGPVDPGHCDRYTRLGNLQIERKHIEAHQFFPTDSKEIKFECRQYYSKPVIEFKGDARSI